MTYLLDTLRASYQNDWKNIIVKKEVASEVAYGTSRINKNIDRYKKVSLLTGVPANFIGIIHYLECNCNFDLHLHNGDPLTKKTVNVPANRPLKGIAPFTWTDSSVDALLLKGLNGATDWTTSGMLYQFERYNGFGYRRLEKPIKSPYLWSGSNLYTKGKYVADGKFDAEKVSKQMGAAVLLKNLLTP